MPNTNNKPKKAAKAAPEQSQTVIIPKLSPEVLAQARRAAEAGTPLTEEQATAAVRAQEQADLAAAQGAAAQTEAPAAAQTATQTEAPTAAQAAAQAAAKPAAKEAASAPAKPLTRAEQRHKAMAAAQEELVQSIHDNHLWLNNPVIMHGLGLAPLVVAAVDADNALMLCVAALLLITGTRVLAVAICHLTGNRFRPLIYCYSAALVYVPAYIILFAIFGNNLAALGLYLPVLVVEPVVIKRMESTELETVGSAFKKGLNNSAGLCIALMLVGCLRELLAKGTIYGNTVLKISVLPIASQPSGGFILVGILAAFWMGIANSYTRYKLQEVKAYYADRR